MPNNLLTEMYGEANATEQSGRKKTSSELKKARLKRKKRERSGKPKDLKRSRSMKKAWSKSRSKMKKGIQRRSRLYSQANQPNATNESFNGREIINEKHQIGSLYEGAKGSGVIVKVETSASETKVSYAVGTKVYSDVLTNEGLLKNEQDDEDEIQKVVGEVIQYLEAEEVTDEWTEAISELDDLVLEAFETSLIGLKKNSRIGEFIAVDIQGKEYGYTPKTGSVKELGRKLAKMLKFSKGKTIAWMKKNSEHQYGGTKPDVPGGSKLIMGPDKLENLPKEKEE